MSLTPQTAEALRLTRRCVEVAAKTKDARLPELIEHYARAQARAAEESPWYFLRVLCKTKNEHASAGNEYEPFPDMNYLKVMLEEWQAVERRPADRLLLVAKSRQMMVSWFACAMVLWYCLFRKAQRIGWQSKKAEDADEMLKRIYGLWDRLPPPMRDQHPCTMRQYHLHFTGSDSDVHAIPQGPDQVRQYTWSLFISDEMAFQEGADAAYFTLLPALGKNGMGVFISTAFPGHFETLFEDEEASEIEGALP